MEALKCISPLDGRYRSKTEVLSEYFSEYALIQYRLMVEVEYLIALSGMQGFFVLTEEDKKNLRSLYVDFNLFAAERIKFLESETNHDVKAVEYYLKEQLKNISLNGIKEFVHFGLTSQDINNTAIPVSLREGVYNALLPSLEELIERLSSLAVSWENVPMLARTHGQPASPTRVGKELQVFVERLNKQVQKLKQYQFHGKFGGATGNFNAHHVAYPNVDWKSFADDFLKNSLGLVRNQHTTQIDHYDDLAELFDIFRRINVILIDLSKDIWQYVSMEYFTQKMVSSSEVGSSAMPHKVNPIDFENAEGNLGMANALLDFFSNKLPVSRLQRDLTDSTVLRNIGVPLGHSLVAYTSLVKGLGKLELNTVALDKDLNKNWAVVSEAIQTVLRRENYPNPYEKLKEFSRGKTQLTQSDFLEFIDNLDVVESVKVELRAITPFNYTGV